MSRQRAIRLVVAYDGTDFGGWQRQKNARSVQEAIENALAKMHGHPVRLTAAGRTDAGVHALGQVAGFFSDIASIPAEKFVLALNKLLPRDVRILQAEEGDEDFHARFDASLRRYRYFMLCGSAADPFSLRYAWHIHRRPSLAKLNAMAGVILGEHDFSTFASAKDISPSKSRFIRESSFWFEGEKLVYQVSANAFLWRMVRSLVGTMLELERGAEDEAQAESLMSAALSKADRAAAGPTAPAAGLFLWDVEYGERRHGHRRRRPSETPPEAHDAEPSPRLVPGLGWVPEP